MSKEKTLKPSKELPLGFVDRQEKELLIRDFVISNIKEIMVKYGFQYLETPSFEYTDSIGKFLPDKDRPGEGVFSFKDENKWLSLRYDLTAPLARYIAKNYLEIPKPFKRYQLGTVWRNEKPGPGRYREFLQFDADYVGTKNLQADAELCVLISEILEKCGLDKVDYTVKISSRKFTDKLFEELKINSQKQILAILRALDKIDRLGWEEAKKLLGEGRKDKSGDYTKGAELKDNQIKIIGDALKNKTANSEDIEEIIKIFKAYNFKNYQFDPSVIRGLEYYTGPIFEVNLNFEVKNLKGKAIQFGSIGGGGRYDNLVNNFGNFDCPATGISIGLDRLVYALMQKKDFKIKSIRPIMICVFDNNKIKEYINILSKLRNSNISSEIYPGEGKLKKQMEYANKIGSPAVILYGEDEIKLGKVTLKNLKTGNESSIKIEDLANEIKKLL
ncbi:MAG: histidine--tRNA ligase [Candidatus Pelagibacterales bacterium]|nr:MAG: histidine--tRNA ligase [Pelagibacterales bacterium]